MRLIREGYKSFKLPLIKVTCHQCTALIELNRLDLKDNRIKFELLDEEKKSIKISKYKFSCPWCGYENFLPENEVERQL